MATLSAKVFKHHKKTDGTYNVKMCIHHNKVRVFMDTEHYVTEKKLDKIFKIKDTTQEYKIGYYITLHNQRLYITTMLVGLGASNENVS